MKINRQQIIRSHRLLVTLATFSVISFSAKSFAVTSATDLQCDSRYDITVAASARSSVASSATCQTRALTTPVGFKLTTSSPSDATVADSSAMVSAGGELYESFVAGIRQAIVLLTPNRTLMMSRNVTKTTGVDWDVGLTVQPVSGGNDAYLTGTYVFLRANRETRVVDAAHQTNAGLSGVFDPVSMRVTFNGDSTCNVTAYSSWFGYELTTDPALFYSQPDGSNYGLHQAVYAGVGSGQQHKDSNLSFSTCSYTLNSSGKLVINYIGTYGDASAFNINNAYFLSADKRYIVSTVDATKDLYRGFEVGVLAATLSGSQSALNNSVAGTYLFNSPSVELQGATGPLTAPDNEHRNNSKATQCINRGAAVLSTTASGVGGWNVCTVDWAKSCTIRSEEAYGETSSGAGNGNVSIIHTTAESVAEPTCRFQVATDSTLSMVINQQTAEGFQDITYSGAIASGNEALVLKGKYEGTNMQNPSNTHAPARTIKNDLYLSTLVGVKYAGTLGADADADGITNEMEFLESGQTSADSDGDGLSDAEEAALGSNPLNNLDPPIPAVGSNYVGGISNYSFDPMSSGVTAWNASTGTLVGAGNVGRASDISATANNDFCVAGLDGVWCMWWVADNGVVYWGKLLPALISGVSTPLQHSYYLGYLDPYSVWQHYATDAFKVSGDHHTHSCAVGKAIGVYCWASDSTTDIVSSGVPGSLKNVATVTDVAVGTSHACAINGSSVQCWGDSSSGKTSVPGVVSAPKRIAAGSNHTCAINSTGTVSCWGDNSLGQLGDGNSDGYVDGVTNAKRIAAGANHTCALTGNFSMGGTRIVCWGDNSSGQTVVPVVLTNGVATPVDLRAAANNTCVTLAGQSTISAALKCWPVDHAP